MRPCPPAVAASRASAAFAREDLARQAAVDDIEAAVVVSVAALDELRDAIARAHRVMPTRHVASFVGVPDATLRRWRVEIPAAAVLRAALAHLRERRR